MNNSVTAQILDFVGIEELLAILLGRPRQRLDSDRVTKLFSALEQRHDSGSMSPPASNTTAEHSQIGKRASSARANRVNTIREAINAGRYEENRTGVATALYRDLM